MKRILIASFFGLAILTTGSLSIKNYKLNTYKHNEIKEAYFHATSLERKLYN